MPGKFLPETSGVPKYHMQQLPIATYFSIMDGNKRLKIFPMSGLLMPVECMYKSDMFQNSVKFLHNSKYIKEILSENSYAELTILLNPLAFCSKSCD